MSQSRSASPAPLAPVAIACVSGLALGPTLAPAVAPSCALGLVCLTLGRRSQAAVLVGWLLLGLARGAPGAGPPPLDAEQLWAFDVRGDGRHLGVRSLEVRVLAAWDPVDTGGRRLSWSGGLDAALYVPGWPGAPARPGERWLGRGRLRTGPRGASLAISQARRLQRVAPAVGGPRAWVDDAILRLRRGARRAIDRGAPPRLRPLFLALALADRTELPPELTSRLSRTGTAHLVALSGLHVGTFLLAVAAAARWVLRRVVIRLDTALAWGGGADTAALWVGLAAAAGYVVVAGAPTSARRALVMAAVAVLARSLRRPISGWNALALAGLLVAWADPPAARALGLHLSLASVGGLLAAPVLRRGGRWLRPVLATLVASAWATVATAPLLGHAFGQVPLASFWANPVAIPLLGGATVPPLLFGAALGAIDADLGAWGVRAAAVPASLGLRFLDWAGDPSRSPMLAWRPTGFTVAALYSAAAAWLWAGVRRG